MLLAVDKPKGITSYDVIRILKKHQGKELPIGKIGHSGTLDPMATGLLLIGLVKDTKRLGELQGLGKSYTTTIDFSKLSDTRDMNFWDEYQEFELTKSNGEITGIIKDGNNISKPNLEAINEKLKLLIPDYPLPLTPFSAKKKDGKKLYELARQGDKTIETRIMSVKSFNIIKYDFPILELQIEVGSGTYIRSIGYWLGNEFGLGGILTSLRRDSIGDIVLNKIDLKQLVDTEIKYAEIIN